ncbi:MAG: acetyltransferase [Clostridia bacterium]|jgi:ribosomal protein S18 acetylase RimI-like enzyme|nr:acetyltransferase [Clostridia bacterium]
MKDTGILAIKQILERCKMDIVIRRATIQDCNAIQELNTAEMGYAYTYKKTLERLQHLLNDNTHRIFVAEVNAEVVAYIHCNSHELLYHDPLTNIMGIAVSKGYKRMGIGRLLLQSVETWASDSGSAGVRLTSGENRTEAHLFYQSCGYQSKKNQKYFTKLFR